ncbi:unnamed protein product [Owenia fusiformis]|uniref:Steroid 21-hydroxylase n=1 Tax=Owenia fusiformis TaxID=6347 RepID=A0A8J1TYF2_OWEFU|nr:unnamed protein product [Owenia fusiformis]
MDLFGFELSEVRVFLIIFIGTAILMRVVMYFLWARTLPPGPMGLPIIGNLHQLGKNPHKTMASFARKYGNVYMIHFGSRPTVVLSDYETVREAMIKHGDDFAGRPDFQSFQYINEGKGVAFSPHYDARWKLLRKIMVNAARLLVNDKKRPIDANILDECDTLIKELLSTNGQPIDPRIPIKMCVGSIIFTLVFGESIASREDQDFKDMIESSRKFTAFQASGGNIADIMPWTKIFTKKRLQEFIELIDENQKLHQRKHKEHVLTYNQEDLRDITDALIKASRDVRKIENMVDLDERFILTLTGEFIGAGFNTVSTFMHWAVLYMASYPKIQSKVHAEISAVIGDGRQPQIGDKINMKYTEACILEINRKSSLTPMALPHATTCDTTLNGYTIPAKTLTFINLWALHHDETTWGDPENFRPERFLDKDGEIIQELAEKVVAFGLGRRRCLGEFIAKLELFLLLTRTLQRCEFAIPEGVTPNMEGVYGLALDPAPFDVTITPRD